MSRVCVVVAVAGCIQASAVAQKVARQYDQSVDFSKYRTYKWVTIGRSGRVNQLTEQNIHTAVELVLAPKGLVAVTGVAPADVFIAYQAIIDFQTELKWYNCSTGFRQHFDRQGWHAGHRFLRRRSAKDDLARIGHQDAQARGRPHKNSESADWKFFAESRYHYAWSYQVPTTFVPVTLGIRFN